MSRPFLMRWLTPEGEANRDRLLSCWRAGLPWRDRGGFPGNGGDARPDLRGLDLADQRLAGCDLSDVRLDHAVLDGL